MKKCYIVITSLIAAAIIAGYIFCIYLPHIGNCGAISMCANKMMRIGQSIRPYGINPKDDEERSAIARIVTFPEFQKACVSDGMCELADFSCSASSSTFGFCPLSGNESSREWILLYDKIDGHQERFRHLFVPSRTKGAYEPEVSYGGGVTITSFSSKKMIDSLVGKPPDVVNVLYASGEWKILSLEEVRSQLKKQGAE